MVKHGISFLIFLIAGIYVTFPLLFNLGNVTTGHGDELVITWILNWVIHSYLTGNVFNIFDANLYYPFHNSLAYSDTFFISSLLAAVPTLLIGEPIAAFNITLIASIIFLGFTVYVLAYYLTKSFISSVIAGLLVVFSPAVLSNVTHVQILAIVGVPIAILFFLLFLEKQKSKYLAFSLIAFVLQTYNSFLPGYFIVISYAVILIVYCFSKKKKIKKIITKPNVLVVIFALLFLIPIVIPYYQVSKEYNYVRDIRDSIHMSLQPEDFLYPGNATRIQQFLIDVIPSNNSKLPNKGFKPGYLGVAFSILVLLSFFYVIKHRKKVSLPMKQFFLLSLTGLLLSFGPILHLFRQTIHDPFPIPLPYAVFYYVLPGFQGFRNSARWEMLFILAIAVVIALVLHKLLSKSSLKKQIVIYSIIIVGIVVEFNFPRYHVSVPQKESFPKVYSWLATTPTETKIIELPIYNWGWWPHTQNELWREYYGTLHFRKTVNGYTGFSPPPWQELITDLSANFPSEATITRLKKTDIDYVLIHADEYERCYESKCGFLNNKNAKEIINEVNSYKHLKFIKRFDDIYLYQVTK